MVRALRDSGVEWLGDIPEDWALGKIGQVYTERREKVSDLDYPPLSVTMQGIVPQLSTAAKSDSHDNRKLVLKGDFAINSRSDRRGSCGISDYDGSVSLINTVLQPKTEMNPEYYSWVFKSSMFSDEFYKWGHGIVDDLWTTKWQEMKKIVIPMPNLDEQRRIADKLQDLCSSIDEMVNSISSSIEEYKKYKVALITEAVTKGIDATVERKSSGVEWIGDIPEEWSISRIKYVSEFDPRCKFESIDDETEIEYAPMECIKNGWYEKRTAKYGELSRSLTSFEEGDIVMAKVTPCFENGNIAIMDEIENGCGLGSSELFVFRVKGISKKFMFYWLRNQLFMDQACATMTGTGGLKRVSSTFVKNSHIAVPPEKEQEKIVEYLDCKCREVDEIIKSKYSLIDELCAYKKSLIYEYVTGKKEVK